MKLKTEEMDRKIEQWVAYLRWFRQLNVGYEEIAKQLEKVDRALENPESIDEEYALLLDIQALYGKYKMHPYELVVELKKIEPRIRKTGEKNGLLAALAKDIRDILITSPKDYKKMREVLGGIYAARNKREFARVADAWLRHEWVMIRRIAQPKTVQRIEAALSELTSTNLHAEVHALGEIVSRESSSAI